MRIRGFFLAILLSFILCSCSNYNSHSTQEKTYDSEIEFQVVDSVYQKDDTNQIKKDAINEEIDILTIYVDNENNIVPCTVKVRKTLTVAKEGINLTMYNENLKKSLSSYGLNPLLPKNIVLRGLTIRDDFDRIDFGNEFYLNSKSDLFIKALTIFLSSFPNVKKVEFLKENQLYCRFDKNKDFNIIYYPKIINNKIFILPKWIKIKYNDKSKYYENILKNLIIEAKGFYKILNGLILYSAYIQGDTLYVNLSNHIMQLKEEDIKIFVQLLIFTAKHFDGVNKLSILVNNKKTALSGSFNGIYELYKYKINPITLNWKEW